MPDAQPPNLFDDLPATSGKEESFDTLLQSPGIRIERIVSLGHCSPDGFWYDQPTNEWVLLVAGAARIQLEGEPPIALRPGSHLHLPAHRRHRVDWTDPHQLTIWLAVHYGQYAM